jgi:hypothetical protein
MSRHSRLWLLAGFVGLLAPAAGLADPCKTVSEAACATPVTACPPRVVVEVPPPEVIFKQAPPTCVKAPRPTCAAGECAPSMVCVPFSVTVPVQPPPMLLPTAPVYSAPAMAPLGAQAPMMAAPAPVMAAPMAYAPAPVAMAPAAAAPVMAVPAPAMAVPMAAAAPQATPAPGYGVPQAAPCGAGSGFGLGQAGAAFGLGATSPGDLEALAAAQRTYQQATLRNQMADIERHRSAISAAAAAYGVSLRPDEGKPSSAGAAAGAARSSSGDGDSVLQEIAKMRQDVLKLQGEVQALYEIGDLHHKALKAQGILPTTPNR